MSKLLSLFFGNIEFTKNKMRGFRMNLRILYVYLLNYYYALHKIYTGCLALGDLFFRPN